MIFDFIIEKAYFLVFKNICNKDWVVKGTFFKRNFTKKFTK